MDVATDLVEVGSYSSEARAEEHGLVVLAQGHPYWLRVTPEGIRLLVDPDVASVARRQLAAYDREGARWPPPPITDPWTPRGADVITPLLWAATVLALFVATQRHPDWIARGALEPHAVFGGREGWRLVTALFLHGDAAHVLLNVLGGVLVFSAVLSTFGGVRGWLLLFGSSALGNLAVAAANVAQPYRSIGASTAIFAGVGLLTGRAVAVAWRSSHPHRWRSMFAPLAAGLIVLALHGAGGQLVDIGAHLAGFTVGTALAGAMTAFARVGR